MSVCTRARTVAVEILSRRDMQISAMRLHQFMCLYQFTAIAGQPTFMNWGVVVSACTQQPDAQISRLTAECLVLHCSMVSRTYLACVSKLYVVTA